jgi:two-component system, cell cycle sensor histidine kinase and response regulator CckA
VITPSVQEIWKESPQELEGTCLYDRMEDEERAFFMEEILNDREIQNREASFSTRAGMVSCAVSARLNPAGPGGSATIIGVLRDITQWKEMEKEKRNLEEKLRQSEKMEALGLLAGGVAHDLNNILSGIVAYPDLIISGLPPESPLTPRLLAIKKSGEKAAAILDDLLNLARRNSLSRQVIDMEDLLRSFLNSPEVEELSRRYPAVKRETRLNAPLSRIEGSPFHLQKMLLNLMVNGMEAQPRGGVLTLSLSCLPDYHGSTRYHEIPRGDYLLLRVEDQGEGIRPEDLDRIFEPFFTRKAMGRSGTGLGMAIVWGTIQDHGGCIDVQSVPDRGTRVDVFLPLTTREAALPPPVKEFSEYRGRGELILVVDDLLTQREINRHLLEKLGYRTRELPSGEAALKFLRDDRADLVLLDMIMEGGMDGLETYRQIKLLHPDQKVIILSGYAESERIEEARLLGIETFLKKPCSLETLGTALHHAFSE